MTPKPCRRGVDHTGEHHYEWPCCSNCTRPRPTESGEDQIDPAGAWIDATGHSAGRCGARIELISRAQMEAMDGTMR